MNRRLYFSSLGYTSLETKNLLSGDVAVIFQDDLMNVIGDSAANQISIVEFSDTGRRVIPSAGTTINGSTEPLSFDFGVRRIFLQMQGGDDSISISGLVLHGDLIIEGGAGNDRINLQDINVRSLSVFGGEGNDVLEFGNVFVHRNILIRGQGGDNTIAITAMATNRSLEIDAGEGQSTVAINNLGVKNSLNFRAGNGSDLVIMTGEVYAHKTRMDLQGGDDVVGVLPQTSGVDTTANFRRTLNINSGSGENQVFFANGASPAKRTLFQGGDGLDSISVDQERLGRQSVRIRGFENTNLTDINAALDTFYSRLADASVESTPFGRESSTQLRLQLNPSNLQLTRSDPATPIDDQLTLGGSDTNIIEATVRIVNYSSGTDRLLFTDQNSIEGVFNDSQGILTISGSATLAQYQAALRSVRYENTSSTFTGNKAIRFDVISENGQTQGNRTVEILTDQQAIDRFAAANSLTLQQTSSGLNYVIETPGNGLFPNSNSSVRVKYRGTLLNGTQFDTNENALFPLSGVIEGFREGLLLFTEGAKGQLFLPSAIAYGKAGTLNIPPNAILRFEIELLSIL